jgi:hypothetical protein
MNELRRMERTRRTTRRTKFNSIELFSPPLAINFNRFTLGIGKVTCAIFAPMVVKYKLEIILTFLLYLNTKALTHTIIYSHTHAEVHSPLRIAINVTYNMRLLLLLLLLWSYEYAVNLMRNFLSRDNVEGRISHSM